MARNSRIGLWLFGFYVLIYSAFVLVNAFAPDLMELTPWLGVNLAIWSGFGLIVIAILMSLVYGFLCKSSGSATASREGAAASEEEIAQ